MPRGMSGMQHAASIRDRWPPIEIVVTSGHHDGPDLDLPARTIFLPEPYWENEVVAALRRIAA